MGTWKEFMEKALNESTINEEKLAGWIAIYGGKKLEIKKSEADGIYGAKQLAIKKLKVPKSKVGLMAIEPAYESTNLDEEGVLNRTKVSSARKNFVDIMNDEFDEFYNEAKNAGVGDLFLKQLNAAYSTFKKSVFKIKGL